MLRPGLWAGAGWGGHPAASMGSVWDVSFSLPASFCSLKLFPIKSYSSPPAFNQSPLHLRGFGAEKASLYVCVDVCYGPEGCSGPRLSSVVSPLPGDHGPCWSVPQRLLASSCGDGCPFGDLQALCEQGKMCKMERSKVVTPGWHGDSPGFPVASLVVAVVPSPPAWCRLCTCLQQPPLAGFAVGTAKSCTWSAISTQG